MVTATSIALLIGFVLGWALSSITYGYRWRLLYEKTQETLELNEEARAAQHRSSEQAAQIEAIHAETMKANADANEILDRVKNLDKNKKAQ